MANNEILIFDYENRYKEVDRFIKGSVCMFYWSEKTDTGTTLDEELLNVQSVEKIKIATAYLSDRGIDLLKKLKQKNDLHKNNIELFISSEFSTNFPHKQLKELQEICNVKIVLNRTFHPKVYWVLGNERKLIFGSSNFTSGGLDTNVEFDEIINAPDSNTNKELTKFFAYCNSISTPVSDELIQYYEEKQKEIEELTILQKKLRKELSGFKQQNDAFSQDDYDLNDYYFTYQDYETFFKRNQDLENIDIRRKRQSVQAKMLQIHKAIYPEIKKLGIACHRREENITSLIRPCIYNRGQVSWIGVRYGKTPEEIDALNYGSEKDDVLGFQKHGCLQYCIIPRGFEINLFLAVKHDAIDREHLHDNFKKLRNNIESELTKLKGNGMEWVIYDEVTDTEYTFDIDEEKPEKFYNYFNEYDMDGRESFLRIFYEPDDSMINSFDNLKLIIFNTIKLLLPLYNAMVYRIKM